MTEPESRIPTTVFEPYFRILGIIGSVATIVAAIGSLLAWLSDTTNRWPLVTAIISSLLLGTIAVIWWLRGVIRKKRHTAFIEGNPETAYEIVSRAIGITKDDLLYEVTMNPNGGGRVRYGYKVRAVSQRVQWVEQKVDLVTHPDGEAADRVRIHPSSFESDNHHVEVERKPDVSGRSALHLLRFGPAIEKGHSVHIPNLDVEVPDGSFAMWRPADDEWCVFKPQYPSDSLIVRVNFPPGYRPDNPRLVVWLGDARLAHLAEAKRLEDSKYFSHGPDPTTTNHFIQLTVSYPLPGVRYGVQWTPALREGATTKGPPATHPMAG